MDDTPKVVSLTGGPVNGIVGTISETLIKNLEDFLERARSGEIVGGILIGVDSNILCSYRIVGYNTNSYQMLGAVSIVKHHILNKVTGDIADDPRPPPVRSS